MGDWGWRGRLRLAAARAGSRSQRFAESYRLGSSSHVVTGLHRVTAVICFADVMQTRPNLTLIFMH